MKLSLGRRTFLIFDYAFLFFISFICIMPMVNVLALSFSSSTAAAAGVVKFWPIDITFAAYKFVLEKNEFLLSLLVTFKRVFLGVPLNMLLTVLIAYPLSRKKNEFRFRTFFAWFFFFTMIFSGGLVPWYMIVKTTKLIDSVWALVLPTAVPIFNVIVLLNFFRDIPKELEEAAFIDGAGHFKTLCKVYIPLSLPALATLVLFSLVGHWNSWFDGIVLMNNPKNYPLQSFLQTVLINRDMKFMSVEDALILSKVSDRTSRAAQIFISLVPILAVYPFLQRYFVTGLTLGSVKG